MIDSFKIVSLKILLEFFEDFTNLSPVVSLSMRSAVRLSAERMRPCGILAPLERRHWTCGVGSPLTPHSNTASRPTNVVKSAGGFTMVGRTEIISNFQNFKFQIELNKIEMKNCTTEKSQIEHSELS